MTTTTSPTTTATAAAAIDLGDVRRIAKALTRKTFCTLAVFIRIVPTGTIHSYGPGARAIDLIRDPLHSGASAASSHDVLGAIR